MNCFRLPLLVAVLFVFVVPAGALVCAGGAAVVSRAVITGKVSGSAASMAVAAAAESFSPAEFAVSRWAAPVTITDDLGRRRDFSAPPRRVVCLVSAATEIIFAIGADDAVVGLTRHDGALPGAAAKTVVGGFFAPDVDRVAGLDPDLVIAAPRHEAALARLEDDVPVLYLGAATMADGFWQMELLGELFGCREAAADLAAKNRRQLDLIARKVRKIPPAKRKRVLRFMRCNDAGDRLLTLGADSFQTELIRAAGGIPPDLGDRNGALAEMTREEFRAFDPEVIYGCGGDREAAATLLQRIDWRVAAATFPGGLMWFPCELTCRAGAHMGDFVSWLAARLYAEEFAVPENELLPRAVTATRLLDIGLDYIRRAVIAESIIHDFTNRSLVIDFTAPCTVVSTLEGQRDGILTVGNHYSSPPCWPINHGTGLAALRAELFPVLGVDGDRAAFLFTGADMSNLAVKTESFRELTVYALVTAGVRGNAVRMSRDIGAWYEPGTINIILLTNATLSPRAMTRALISATEAKSAALQDLDIRSAYQPLTAAATGTGTDNIIVVSGIGGIPIDATGGHSKTGELIARAVYAGVREAIAKQNGIVSGRDIFQLLEERHLDIFALVRAASPESTPAANRAFAARFEGLLLEPAYAGLVETALALADGVERGTVHDLCAFAAACRETAGHIAGRPVEECPPMFTGAGLPEPLALAFDALVAGLAAQGQ
ncbi:MAG: adenosylcobinamide amidohydrolase [Deltaproteobacteria bacterium]|nr:adenosylcobinamide amidohydrolase [Candidatus Anaeroferrophillacea bacterium]